MFHYLSALHWEVVWRYREVFFRGWLETLMISASALVVSSSLALLIVAARRSSKIFLKGAALCFIELIRGTPFLTQILFFFYVVASALGFQNRIFAGIVILSLFSSAYIAEMIRAGFEAIPLSQWESAKALGLKRFQTYRFVIMPQAIRHMLPSLTGQFASLIKDSSLLSIIGIAEFTLAAEQVNAATYCTLESFFPLAIGYLIITVPLSLGSRCLEKRFKK